ncbi:MAG: fused MFS/spermidine synthase [Candidatus Omnitrophica bacterium]|nr:fused MFS/spermidine synthase [Candidatus Omnitrophota bacterium]
MSALQRETAAVLRNVHLCYFLSGALGLAYQILWLRKLLLVFGSTVHAVSTVLTVFFGGLALGSWLFGRLIDRPRWTGTGLRWYAALEVGVGLCAFATLPLFEAMQRLYLPAYQASGFSPAILMGGAFVCSAAILLVPTTLLGGTFPVLSRFLIRSSEGRGPAIATLYAVNTAGAMAGTLLVYFVGLPVLGMFRTLLCAGILNVGIGLLCLAFDRHLATLGWTAPRAADTSPAARPSPAGEGVPSERKRVEGPPRQPLGPLRWVFAAFALSGFSAMVYEVAWTRALSLVLGSSTYAFCLMLATFLGGIALGSALARRDLRARPATVKLFIDLELWLGGYGLLSVWLFSQLPSVFLSLWPAAGRTFAGLLWLQATLSALAMLTPTLMLGVLFPLVSDLVTTRFGQFGERLGAAYAVNTAGGILGSFLAGFALIPWLGLPGAIVAAALVNLLAAAVLYVRFEPQRALPVRLGLAALLLAQAAWLGAAAVVPAWQRQAFAAGVYMYADRLQPASVEEGAGAKLLYYRDGLNTTVSVHQTSDTTFLRVGGKTDASNGRDMGTQVLAAHVPLLMHADPQRVLVIGLGSGVTLGHAARHPVSLVHCAEIEPAVIEAARYFKKENYGVHEDPKVRIIAADGRNFLRATREAYDVIISEPSNPWMTGVAALFTEEFYELAKARLAPDGIMCQWLQLYGLFPNDVKLMLKTFHEAFPHVSVWSSAPGDLLLIGSMASQRLDHQRLSARMAAPAVHDSLAVVHAERPNMLLQLFWFGTREVEALTADITWVHEDDQPSVEFNAPKSLYARDAFRINSEGLKRFAGRPRAIALDYAPEEDAEFYRALARLRRFRDEREEGMAALERAVELDPSSGDTWRQLGTLALERHQPLRAQEAWLRAIEADPADAEAHRLLARLSRQQGQREEAQAWYRRAAAIARPDGMFAAELGDVLREAGELPLAVECYRSAMSLGGGDRPPFLLAYGRALRDLRAWEEGEWIAAFAMRQFPSDGAFPLLLGETLLAQERWRDAEPLLARAAELDPRSAEAYSGLGRAALGQGARAEAARWFERALAQDPYHRRAAQGLYDALN